MSMNLNGPLGRLFGLGGSQTRTVSPQKSRSSDYLSGAEDADVFERRVRSALATASPPADLWPRIRTTLHAEDTQRSGSTRRALALVAVGVAGALIAVAFLAPIFRAPAPLPAWIVEAPVRDLRTFIESRRPVDVLAVNPQHLQGWFAGKVDFTPPLPAAPAGLDLLGGRLCDFLHRRAASYMYRTGEVLVSHFVYPEAGLGIDGADDVRVGAHLAAIRQIDGFTHVLWKEDGLVHSVVSAGPRARVIRWAQQLSGAG